MKKIASLNDTNVVYYYKIVDSENNINDHLRKYLEVQTLYPTERTVKVRREDIPRYMLNGAAGKLTRDEYDRLMSGNHVDVKDYLVKNDKDEFVKMEDKKMFEIEQQKIKRWIMDQSKPVVILGDKAGIEEDKKEEDKKEEDKKKKDKKKDKKDKKDKKEKEKKDKGKEKVQRDNDIKHGTNKEGVERIRRLVEEAAEKKRIKEAEKQKRNLETNSELVKKSQARLAHQLASIMEHNRTIETKTQNENIKSVDANEMNDNKKEYKRKEKATNKSPEQQLVSEIIEKKPALGNRNKRTASKPSLICAQFNRGNFHAKIVILPVPEYVSDYFPWISQGQAYVLYKDSTTYYPFNYIEGGIFYTAKPTDNKWLPSILSKGSDDGDQSQKFIEKNFGFWFQLEQSYQLSTSIGSDWVSVPYTVNAMQEHVLNTPNGELVEKENSLEEIEVGECPETGVEKKQLGESMSQLIRRFVYQKTALITKEELEELEKQKTISIHKFGDPTEKTKKMTNKQKVEHIRIPPKLEEETRIQKAGEQKILEENTSDRKQSLQNPLCVTFTNTEKKPGQFNAKIIILPVPSNIRKHFKWLREKQAYMLHSDYTYYPFNFTTQGKFYFAKPLKLKNTNNWLKHIPDEASKSASFIRNNFGFWFQLEQSYQLSTSGKSAWIAVPEIVEAIKGFALDLSKDQLVKRKNPLEKIKIVKCSEVVVQEDQRKNSTSELIRTFLEGQDALFSADVQKKLQNKETISVHMTTVPKK